MELLTRKRFDFASNVLDPNTFGVVHFEGSEGLSQCYRFDISLVSNDFEIDLNKVLQNPAVFTIIRNEGNIPFHGILAEFEQQHAVKGYAFYRAMLVPKLWWLNLTYHNQIFLDMNVPDILAAVLQDGGLTPSKDFDIRLQKQYSPLEYVCQYRESHYAFVSRWMEREGLYYFFEQTDDGEKMVITDSSVAHTPMPQGKTLYYSPPSGLETLHTEEIIRNLVCRQRMLPQKVMLRDYNYRTPSLEIKGDADVLEDGRGEIYMYGDHFGTAEEGKRLAKIRAEEMLCRKELFIGESGIPYLRPGYVFDLEDHYRHGYNQKYLTADIHHRGGQAGFFISGLKEILAEREQQPYYANTFTTIPADVQFRPERITEKARFYGSLNAKVDAAGSGQYAELDNQGRYKIILPFDLSGRKDGKASAFLRMAQPYAGTDHGMHFPLHKGTEVLLTFIDGDPDRPIISAAVPNPGTPSMVASGNATMAGIKTASGNKISFQDMEGDRRIIISAAGDQSQIICSEGNSGLLVSKTDFEAHCAKYNVTTGGLVGTTFGSLGQSSIAGAWLWTLFNNLASYYADSISKKDDLGKKLAEASGKSYTGYNTKMLMALNIVPMATNQLFSTWLVYSMAKALEKDKMFRVGTDFGPVSKRVLNEWEDDTFTGRLKKIWDSKKTMSYVGNLLSTFAIGNTGSYGVCLFSRCSADFDQTGMKWLTRILDPRVGSLLKLSPGLPDVLIASNKGFVDVAGEKGINLFSADRVAVEAPRILLKSNDQTSVTGQGAAITVGRGWSLFDSIINMDAREFDIGMAKSKKLNLYSEEVMVGMKDPYKLKVAQDRDDEDKGPVDAKQILHVAKDYIGIGKIPTRDWVDNKSPDSLQTEAKRVEIDSKDLTDIRSNTKINIGVFQGKQFEKETPEVNINAKNKISLESKNELNIKSTGGITMTASGECKIQGATKVKIL